jgi:hypothetical protein
MEEMPIAVAAPFGTEFGREIFRSPGQSGEAAA